MPHASLRSVRLFDPVKSPFDGAHRKPRPDPSTPAEFLALSLPNLGLEGSPRFLARWSSSNHGSRLATDSPHSSRLLPTLGPRPSVELRPQGRRRRKPAFVDDGRRSANDAAFTLRDKTPIWARRKKSCPISTGLVPARSVFQMNCFCDVRDGHQAKSYIHAFSPVSSAANSHCRTPVSLFFQSDGAAPPESSDDSERLRHFQPSSVTVDCQ